MLTLHSSLTAELMSLNPHETRKLVASPKVATYDMQPEMSAPEVCENVLEAIENKRLWIYSGKLCQP